MMIHFFCCYKSGAAVRLKPQRKRHTPKQQQRRPHQDEWLKCRESVFVKDGIERNRVRVAVREECCGDGVALDCLGHSGQIVTSQKDNVGVICDYAIRVARGIGESDGWSAS